MDRRGRLAALALLTTCACGGGNASPPPADTAANARRAAPADGASAGGGAFNRCPLTAEQVSAAVGAPVKGPDTACGFFPVDDTKMLPNAFFVLQVAFACNGNMPAEMGYTQRVEGFDVAAYVADMANGTHVLVCRAGRPFEISVDVADDAKARTAATRLAREVLAGS
jgi:hypothetical protein